VAKDTPGHVPLTSFSILFARYKGDLRTLVEGLDAVERLRPGDRILIAEACTHHPTSDDIGRVKIPRWLENKVGGPLHFELCVGGDFPEDLESYSLVLHCGACMITRKAMLHRIMTARAHKVPITNYGVMIAWVHGILPRALAPLGISWPLRAPERLEIRTILASAGDPPESAGRYTPHRSMPNGGPSVI
jgi:predicted GTPase